MSQPSEENKICTKCGLILSCKWQNNKQEVHMSKCGFVKTHCHCSMKWKEPAPTPVVEPKPVSPPPVVPNSLSADPRWSMGSQPHIPSAQHSMPPHPHPMSMPPSMISQMSMPRPPPGVDVVSEILNLTKLVASLEKMLMLQQETINKQHERIQDLEQQRAGSDTFLLNISDRVYAIEQAKVENEAAKTVTVQNPKPRNFVKPHVDGKKPYFKGEKKSQEQQPSEGKKPFKPYHKGKKERKFQGPKPEISQEPYVPDIVVTETETSLSPSKERKVVAINVDTGFLAEEVAPGNWGDVVESD